MFTLLFKFFDCFVEHFAIKFLDFFYLFNYFLFGLCADVFV